MLWTDSSLERMDVNVLEIYFINCLVLSVQKVFCGCSTCLQHHWYLILMYCTFSIFGDILVGKYRSSGIVPPHIVWCRCHFISVYFSAYIKHTGGFNHKSAWTLLGSSPQTKNCQIRELTHNTQVKLLHINQTKPKQSFSSGSVIPTGSWRESYSTTGKPNSLVIPHQAGSNPLVILRCCSVDYSTVH